MKSLDNDNDYTDIKLPKKVYTKIEKAVVELYVKLGIDSYPIDPFAIIEKLGFVLHKYSELSTYEQSKLKNKKLDAISCFDPDSKTFIIYYDDSKFHRRIRFTLMHEVGHIVLCHKEESELAKKMADYFAAYALAPSPIIYEYECEDYNDLAEIFLVTDECAIYSFKRYSKWLEFGGRIKAYEEDLLNMYECTNKTSYGGDVS